MLLSVLLTLTPIKPTTLEGYFGRQAHAWFLSQVERYDSDLSAHLHYSTIRLLNKLKEDGYKDYDYLVCLAQKSFNQWFEQNTNISPKAHESPQSLLDIIRHHCSKELNNVDNKICSQLLRQIKANDAELGKKYHRYSQQRPYSISDLWVFKGGPRGDNGRIHIVPGNECQLRITSLSKPLSELFLAEIVTNLPQTLRLKQVYFKELRLSEENEWDEVTTYEALAKQAANILGDSVTFNFASPTAFRSGQVDLTLPTPDQVWRSLWWRWNTFAPEELHIDPMWPEFAANCIVVSDFCLRSRKVSFRNGSKGAATGATGQITYRLLSEKHCGEFASFRPGAEQVLRTLAGFAIFSGVGHHTTIGLGQTRWLS
ncbi:MAG: CRISPR system precrRNA processing endoribonuclease RAMP protein Cas6 [Anaerolineales bacterium]|nr:CRISPR system precrRNA processing endoribonuclease RAMP protein Cas6 [Anaerolineales bacterium]